MFRYSAAFLKFQQPCSAQFQICIPLGSPYTARAIHIFTPGGAGFSCIGNACKFDALQLCNHMMHSLPWGHGGHYALESTHVQHSSDYLSKIEEVAH
jgi:hypothetical protein